MQRPPGLEQAARTLVSEIVDVHRTLWVVGSLRCILVTIKNPNAFAVHVFHGDNPVYMEHCTSEDDAVNIGERFKAMFTEPGI